MYVTHRQTRHLRPCPSLLASRYINAIISNLPYLITLLLTSTRNDATDINNPTGSSNHPIRACFSHVCVLLSEVSTILDNSPELSRPCIILQL